MSMVLSEEQVMLRDSAADYFSNHASIAQFRKLRETPGALPKQQLTQLTEFGWTGILVPEEYGGLGFGLGGLAVIAMEAGRHLSVTPLFSSSALAVNALIQCQQSDERDSLLSAIAAGDQVATIAWNEESHFNGTKITCEIKNQGEGDRLTGVKPQVKDASNADSILVVALKNESPVVGLVDVNAACIQSKQVGLIDRLDYSDIQFDNTPVESCLSWQTDSQSGLQEMLNCGALLAACELFGMSEEVFERTRLYLIERTQFDRPIGSFQALQHRMSKLYTQLQLLKSVVLDAMSAMDKQRDDRSLAVSHAKAFANKVSRQICNEAIQMHGGMGLTDEVDIGLFFKRARVLQAQYGDEQMHISRFADLKGY